MKAMIAALAFMVLMCAGCILVEAPAAGAMTMNVGSGEAASVSTADYATSGIAAVADAPVIEYDCPCASADTDMCSVAAAVAAPGHELSETARLDTLMSLLPRTLLSTHIEREPQPTPWTVLTLSALCVLRV